MYSAKIEVLFILDRTVHIHIGKEKYSYRKRENLNEMNKLQFDLVTTMAWKDFYQF